MAYVISLFVRIGSLNLVAIELIDVQFDILSYLSAVGASYHSIRIVRLILYQIFPETY